MIRTLTALSALLVAAPALASDMTPLPIPTTRAFNCYIGAGVTGSFIRDGLSAVELFNLNNGSADWGAEPNGGCDLLFSWGVIGVEGDYAFSGSGWSSSVLGTPVSMSFGDEYHINARLGAYTTPAHHTLLYVLGGWASTTGGRTLTVGGTPVAFGTSSGYDVGGGIETNIANIGNALLKGYIEYKHDFLNEQSSAHMTLNTDVDRVTMGLRVQF
jgi:hypothetical protein